MQKFGLRKDGSAWGLCRLFYASGEDVSGEKDAWDVGDE